MGVGAHSARDLPDGDLFGRQLEPDDLQDSLGDMRRESARMARLIDDLLLLARTDAEGIGHMVRPEPVSLEVIAREAPRLRESHGDAWLARLRATVDAAEAAEQAWHASEPRIWRRLLRAFWRGIGRDVPASPFDPTRGGARPRPKIHAEYAGPESTP